MIPQICVRVPGKIMLAGEYVVLGGAPALATTVDCHMMVRGRVRLRSPRQGCVVGTDLWTSCYHVSEAPPNTLPETLPKTLPETLPKTLPKTLDETFTETQFQSIDNTLVSEIPPGMLNHSHTSTSQAPLTWQPISQIPRERQPLLRAVAHGLRLYGNRDQSQNHSYELRIDSEIDPRFGLGSSSALNLGVLVALKTLYESQNAKPATYTDPENIAKNFASNFASNFSHLPLPSTTPNSPYWNEAREAFKLQRSGQSRASGYDIATQLLGGLVTFTGQNLGEGPWPLSAEQINVTSPHPLSGLLHVFVGKGSPTGPLVRSTFAWLNDQGIYQELYSLDQNLQHEFIRLIKDPQQPLVPLLAQIGRHRRIFCGAPQYPINLIKALENLPGCDQSWSFKTSGAGGEDAIMIFGRAPEIIEPMRAIRKLGWNQLDISFDRCGLRVQRGEGLDARTRNSR